VGLLCRRGFEPEATLHRQARREDDWLDVGIYAIHGD
jgi:hypothetical protein